MERKVRYGVSTDTFSFIIIRAVFLRPAVASYARGPQDATSHTRNILRTGPGYNTSSSLHQYISAHTSLAPQILPSYHQPCNLPSSDSKLKLRLILNIKANIHYYGTQNAESMSCGLNITW